MRNAQVLMRKYSLGFYGDADYPSTENVAWYRKHCKPKLKVKIMADGDLLEGWQMVWPELLMCESPSSGPFCPIAPSDSF